MPQQAPCWRELELGASTRSCHVNQHRVVDIEIYEVVIEPFLVLRWNKEQGVAMKYVSLLVTFLAVFGSDAFSPRKSFLPCSSEEDGIGTSLTANLATYCVFTEANKAVNLDLKKAAGTAFAAFTIGSSILTSPIANAFDATPQPFTFSSTNIVAEKVVRQGLYQEYEVDIVQERDDARSTFKGAAETKSKKGKYTAILAILIVGSFIVPMAQYFWYVKDDDSSERFFGTKGRLASYCGRDDVHHFF